MTDGWGKDGWPLDTVETFAPCPVCESVNRWQDLRGQWHCVRCKADEGRRAMENTARLLAVKERNGGTKTEGDGGGGGGRRIATRRAGVRRS